MSLILPSEAKEPALAITPLVKAGLNIDQACRKAAEAGFDAVQLDATLSGIRPRELNSRARKDLAATVSRRGLLLTGLDFFIPPADYLDNSKVDEAVHKTLAAIELAADLGSLPLNFEFPDEQDDEKANTQLAEAFKLFMEAAEHRSISLAILFHAEHNTDSAPTIEPAIVTGAASSISLPWPAFTNEPFVGFCLNPYASLSLNQDPASLITQLDKQLFAARINDGKVQAGSLLPCPLGEGKLDAMRYRLNMDLMQNLKQRPVMDLNGLSNPANHLKSARQVWDKAKVQLG